MAPRTTFFQRQQRARQRTGLLVVYFLLSVVLISLTLNVSAYLVVANMPVQFEGLDTSSLTAWLAEPVWLWVTAVTLMIIGGGTLVAYLQLRDGGTAIAEMVGARPISPDTSDLAERRLVNVVEEMAIASGTPSPRLYVMDNEPGINAFVAGYRPSEAILVVTSGSLEHLDRDELQGVIGHEFSHVLNGDMRLNIRLLAGLSGILLLGQMGGYLMRSMRFASHGRSSSRGGAGLIVILLAGLAMVTIGYIGLFFGRLIKAAVSRQREHLADASSVQFTRNPHGIAGALYKIKSQSEGSLLQNRHAEDMSHMCFGESVSVAMSGMFSTHPPLDERIRAIDPEFLVRMRARELSGPKPGAPATKPATAAPASPSAGLVAAAGAMGFAASAGVVTAAEAVASIGQPSPAHYDRAVKLHQQLPDILLDRIHAMQSASGVVLGLLLQDTVEADRGSLAKSIEEALGPEARDTALDCATLIDGLPDDARLAILDLCLPTLLQLDAVARARTLAACQAVIAADKRYSVWEFVVLSLLEDHFDARAERDQPVRFKSFDRVLPHLRVLFSALSRVGAKEDQARKAAFAAVMGCFLPAHRIKDEPPEPLSDNECNAARLSLALKKLNMLAPILKQSVLNACADCVLHDNVVRTEEQELLRAIAGRLDCPMPPLLGNAV